jgi:hypothetical protein
MAKTKPTKTETVANPKKTRTGEKPSEKPVKGSGWEFAAFTKKAVAFTGAANKLASAIKKTYGDGVSISAYEKMVNAFPTMEKDRQSLVFIDLNINQLLQTYRSARDARDSERESFRGETKVADVESGLAAIAKMAADNPEAFTTGNDSEMGEGL